VGFYTQVTHGWCPRDPEVRN